MSSSPAAPAAFHRSTPTPGSGRSPKVGFSSAARRRSIPWLVTGVLLVAGCALAFTIVSVRMAGRTQVLALAKTVPAGHVLTTADLRVVRVAADPDVHVVPAGSLALLVGRSVAVPLPAGSLLQPNDLGAATFPEPGQAVVAIPAKPGQYPPSVEAGAPVEVVTTGSASNSGGTSSPGPGGTSPGGTQPVPATVVSIDTSGSGDQGQGEVISLLVPAGSVQQVSDAVAAGQVSLALLPRGR